MDGWIDGDGGWWMDGGWMDGSFWPLDGRLTRVLAWLAGMPNGIAGARLRGRRSFCLSRLALIGNDIRPHLGTRSATVGWSRSM